MKKIFSILIIAAMVLSMSGCSKNTGEDTPKGETKNVKLVSGSYLNLFDEDTKYEIQSLYDYMDDQQISLIGEDFPVKTFTNYNGEEVTLPEGSYAFEIVGSWCTYCQQLSKEVMDNLVKSLPNVKFYQYFSYGQASDVDSFYETIEKDMNPEIEVLTSSTEFDKWLEEKGFASVPMMIIVDGDGKMSLLTIGYNSLEHFENLISYAMENKLSQKETVLGGKFADVLKDQKAAKKYIEELESIDVPIEYFN